MLIVLLIVFIIIGALLGVSIITNIRKHYDDPGIILTAIGTFSLIMGIIATTLTHIIG